MLTPATGAVGRRSEGATIVVMVRRHANALSDASDALYETCDNCHKRFMKK